MPRGPVRQKILLSPPLVKEMLSNKTFRRLVNNGRIKVSRLYYVPYLTGISNDGNTVYVDKTPKLTKEELKILVVRELSEKALMSVFELEVDQARAISVGIERSLAQTAGITWASYDRRMRSMSKFPGAVKLTDLPADLDVSTYKRKTDARPNLHKTRLQLVRPSKRALGAITNPFRGAALRRRLHDRVS